MFQIRLRFQKIDHSDFPDIGIYLRLVTPAVIAVTAYEKEFIALADVLLCCRSFKMPAPSRNISAGHADPPAIEKIVSTASSRSGSASRLQGGLT